MKMKSLAAIVAVAAIAASASAQRPGMGGPGMGGMRGPMSPQQQADMMTQRMTQELGLNAAQQAKVKAIVLKNAIAMKKLRDGQMADLKKVLTAAQAQKLGTMRGFGRGMGGGMGRPGGPGGPGMGRPRP